MGLLSGSTAVPVDQIRKVRDELREELAEFRPRLDEPAGASAATAMRARTVRDLVDDTLALVPADSAQRPRERLIEEANLLYDAVLTAAEFWKLFIRIPTPESPAGQI